MAEVEYVRVRRQLVIDAASELERLHPGCVGASELRMALSPPDTGHAIGEDCDICDGRGFDYIGRECRRLVK